MRTNRILMAALVCVGLSFTALTLWASDPVGVYGIVEKVVFEPNDKAPQRIQVWGAFAVAQQSNPNDYKAAERGYLYYTVTPGKESIALKEWNDLKAVAGTGQPVAFGVRWGAKDRVRKAADKPESPDVYTLGVGVTKLNTSHRLYTELKNALTTK